MSALRAAQLAHDHQSPPEDDDLLASYLTDPQKVAEADEWIEGTIDLTGMETLLANLHEVAPDSLRGSDLLADLYRRAKEAHTARVERLALMVEEARDQAEADHGEYLAGLREDLAA